MENFTRTQIILLVLLVSFFTSLVTGIVTVTLVNQAPQPLTQTINRVIEKTVEKIISGENQSDPQIQLPAISKDDKIVNIVQNVSPSIVSVIAAKDIPVVEEYYVNFPNLFFELPDIKVPQYRQKGVEKKQVASASGFFISSDGLILTNNHVVEDSAAEYSILLNDGKKINVTVLAKDPFQDIAILKVEGVEGKENKFSFLSLGDSNKIKIGQSVIAIGNVLGEFQNSVSAGIISGLDRNVLAAGSASGYKELYQLIQTDAAINKGNSGGPLLNLDGEVIGINTALATGAENVGFALPINIAKRDIQDVKEFGEIKYPFLGIRYEIITSALKEEKKLPVDYGILLIRGANNELSIFKDGPADKAGLKEGDIILQFNETKLDKKNSLGLLLSKSRIGDNVVFKVLREEKEITVSVILGESPKNL